LKIENTKYSVRLISQMTGIVAVLLCAVFGASGCTALSFLLSQGWHEEGVPPAYDLQEQQERKVMVWVECPRSANADSDIQDKLATAFRLYLIGKAEFDPDNIILSSLDDSKSLLLDPKKIARSQGAGYLLLVQVDKYETDFLQIRDYYAGEMISRAILYDVDSDQALWPSEPEGKMIHVVFEMESKGRDALVSKLTSATAHCVSRNLYPCDKLKYKTSGDRISVQEAYEMETY
jgi:hypothetical protein